MFFDAALKGSALDNLDRGVVLALMGGLLANAVETAVIGFSLTLLAGIIYGLIRNRVANLDKFSADEFDERLCSLVDMPSYTSLCRWLGSEELFYGLLDDICETRSHNNLAARRYLHNALLKAACYRLKLRLLTLFGLDRFIN